MAKCFKQVENLPQDEFYRGVHYQLCLDLGYGFGETGFKDGFKDLKCLYKSLN